MFLYLILLFNKPCYSALTSMELFDAFDGTNIDFELPTEKLAMGNKEADIMLKTNFNNTVLKDNTTTGNVKNFTEEAHNKQASTYKFHKDELLASIGNISREQNNNNRLFEIFDDMPLDKDTTKGIRLNNSTGINNDTHNNHNRSNETATLISKNTTGMHKQLNNTVISQNGTVHNASDSGNTTKVINNTVVKKGTNYNETAQRLALEVVCPDEEPPINIGPYEVPTQRDIMLHIRNHLLAMFNGFHTKAMNFLKDIKEATLASWSRKMYCQGPVDLMHYRRCVRWVGDLSVLTTKSLVTAMETMRVKLDTLIKGKICNISSLQIDPIHLIRILAAEKVSLEFALPDFLRQLHACARYCPSSRRPLPTAGYHKSTRLTDMDFVLRHYFTQQNYNEQLKHHYKF